MKAAQRRKIASRQDGGGAVAAHRARVAEGHRAGRPVAPPPASEEPQEAAPQRHGEQDQDDVGEERGQDARGPREDAPGLGQDVHQAARGRAPLTPRPPSRRGP